MMAQHHDQVTECVPGKPALVVTWLGLKPELTAIGLNSHMDVVSGSHFSRTINDLNWIQA